MLNNILSKKNWVLLSELVKTDFKLRYQGSILGYAWSLLRPLFMFIILYVVFTKFLRVGDTVPHYPIYLLLGIVLWQFFADMTSQSLSSVVARGDLIRKIRIPRWMIVLTSSVSAIINLGLNMLVVAVFMVVNRADVGINAVYFPLILIQIYAFAVGLSLFLSAAFVKYRDISFIWEVVLQAGFYMTPVLYPLTLISNVTFQKLLLLNPMAQAIQEARNMLVTEETLTMSQVYENSAIILIPITISLTILIIGVLYFKKQSEYFAENL